MAYALGKCTMCGQKALTCAMNIRRKEQGVVW
ncbi:hypothetical protein SRRS_09250 [Sporomusa rhizae]